jgi:putative peptidoglycan lipid II flippase
MLDATDTTPEEPPLPDALREDSGVVRAAAILAAGNVVSRILGLARETVKANLFGASSLLAAYEIAAHIPISLFDLIIGGMVNSSLVPVFSDYAAKERREVCGAC